MASQSSTSAVASIPDAYIAISICFKSKIRVMNVTPEVRDMLLRLDQETATKFGSSRGPLVEYYGTLKMKIGNMFTFAPNGGKDSATHGKLFAVRLLEEMFNLGYNLVTSSQLAQQYDYATLFFAKSAVPNESREGARVCCIAPTGCGGLSIGSSKLTLLHHDDHIKAAVMLALGDARPDGVSGSKDVVSSGETLHEITLSGYWGGADADGIHARKTVCSLVGRMGEIHWKLLASTNLNGIADSFFFIYDPTFSAHPNDFCMLTLDKMDRFRLINCNHLLEAMESAITSAGLTILEKRDYHGSHEIKVHGAPWHSDDLEAVAARRSISRIMEVFGQKGYPPFYAIDVAYSLTDKSSILFRKNPHPVNCRYACLSLTSWNMLRLLDFPVDVGVPMRDSIYQYYPFGVANEVNLPDSNLELKLQKLPWVAGACSKGDCQYHMRAVLGKMMAVAAQHGWHVSISADVSSRTNSSRRNMHHPLDVHSIYFVKSQ